jgi:hypothetical protein
MKKLYLIVFISLFFSFASNAQYKKGDLLLNAGLGLGYYYAGGVPLMLSGEYAFTDKLTIGPYLSYTSWNNGYFGNRYRYSFIDFGVRGSYHFSELIGIRDRNLDIYGGGFLGYLVSSFNGNAITGYNDVYGGGLRLGIHAGARYFFNPKFAGYGELGYGLASLSLGVTFKL